MPDTHVQRVGSLEIDQDLDFQRRIWVIQRVSWGLMAVAIIAALLGVFGSGPLSQAMSRDPQVPLALAYARVTRYQQPTTVTVQLDPGIARGETVRVWFTAAYLHGVQVQGVMPQPERVEADAERIFFVFRLSQPTASIMLLFHLQQQKMGLRTGQVGVEQSPPLTFSQFVYP